MLDNRDAKKQAVFQRQRFVASFNQLVGALHSFAQEYNADHAIDVKKVKALKKAWRELESSDEWFKPRKE